MITSSRKVSPMIGKKRGFRKITDYYSSSQGSPSGKKKRKEKEKGGRAFYSHMKNKKKLEQKKINVFFMSRGDGGDESQKRRRIRKRKRMISSDEVEEPGERTKEEVEEDERVRKKRIGRKMDLIEDESVYFTPKFRNEVYEDMPIRERDVALGFLNEIEGEKFFRTQENFVPHADVESKKVEVKKKAVKKVVKKEEELTQDEKEKAMIEARRKELRQKMYYSNKFNELNKKLDDGESYVKHIFQFVSLLRMCIASKIVFPKILQELLLKNIRRFPKLEAKKYDQKVHHVEYLELREQRLLVKKFRCLELLQSLFVDYQVVQNWSSNKRTQIENIPVFSYLDLIDAMKNINKFKGAKVYFSLAIRLLREQEQRCVKRRFKSMQYIYKGTNPNQISDYLVQQIFWSIGECTKLDNYDSANDIADLFGLLFVNCYSIEKRKEFLVKVCNRFDVEYLKHEHVTMMVSRIKGNRRIFFIDYLMKGFFYMPDNIEYGLLNSPRKLLSYMSVYGLEDETPNSAEKFLALVLSAAYLFLQSMNYKKSFLKEMNNSLQKQVGVLKDSLKGKFRTPYFNRAIEELNTIFSKDLVSIGDGIKEFGDDFTFEESEDILEKHSTSFEMFNVDEVPNFVLEALRSTSTKVRRRRI